MLRKIPYLFIIIMILSINMVGLFYFIFINFFLFFKLIFFIFIKIFLINAITSKIIILNILTFIIIFIIKKPDNKTLNEENIEIRRINSLFKYSLKKRYEHVLNIFIIIIVTSTILIGTFYIRIINKERVLNLKEQLYILKNLIWKTTLFENILNILLFILVIILYFIIINSIVKFLKFHVIKRHLYMVGPLYTTNFYKSFVFEKIFFKYCLSRVNIDLFINKVYNVLYFQWCKKDLPINFDSLPIQEQLNLKRKPPIDPFFFSLTYPSIELFLWHILTKGHYVLFIIIFFYDMYINNYQVTLLFTILPWTLFYEFYLRFSNFIDDLWLYYDEIIYAILYSKSIEIWDEHTLKIDGEFYDYDQIKTIYNNYVLKDFKKDIIND